MLDHYKDTKKSEFRFIRNRWFPGGRRGGGTGGGGAGGGGQAGVSGEGHGKHRHRTQRQGDQPCLKKQLKRAVVVGARKGGGGEADKYAKALRRTHKDLGGVANVSSKHRQHNKQSSSARSSKQQHQQRSSSNSKNNNGGGGGNDSPLVSHHQQQPLPLQQLPQHLFNLIQAYYIPATPLHHQHPTGGFVHPPQATFMQPVWMYFFFNKS